jgi:hypothetical protein
VKKRYTLLILLIIISSLFAEKYYYYHPDIKIGSEAYFNPISMSLNGGFDILRNGAHDKRLTGQHYQNGAKLLFRGLANPNKYIENVGWDNFLAQEFPNVNMTKEKLNFMPNFPIHTIGEGMRFRKVSEWYDYHGYPYPKTLGLVTSVSYQLFNETLEQNDTPRVRTDPIADVYFYNNLGFILFSLDSVNQFFSKTFIINDWSLQPMYNPFNDNIENAGEQYMGKLHIKNDYSLFCYWGMDFLAGTSKKINENYSLSFGAGRIVNKIRTDYINGEYVPVVSTIDYAAGIFYDYQNSLLASSHFSFNKDIFKIKVNLYPGLFEFKGIRPGLYSKLSYEEGKITESVIGMSLDKFPFGFSVGESTLNN